MASSKTRKIETFLVLYARFCYATLAINDLRNHRWVKKNVNAFLPEIFMKDYDLINDAIMSTIWHTYLMFNFIGDNRESTTFSVRWKNSILSNSFIFQGGKKFQNLVLFRNQLAKQSFHQQALCFHFESSQYFENVQNQLKLIFQYGRMISDNLFDTYGMWHT